MPTDTLLEMDKAAPFHFECHQGVPCFNKCCRDLNQFLTPYDILCLKQFLDISSTDFLRQYTVIRKGPQTGLPVVSLRPTDLRTRECPFLKASGCGVYDARPSSCRIYPLIRISSKNRNTGVLSERYFLLKEKHCRGFGHGALQSVGDWIKIQGLDPYNKANDKMMGIISAKNQSAPSKLDDKEEKFFVLALYDLDRFREQMSNDPKHFQNLASMISNQESEEGFLNACMGFIQKRFLSQREREK